MFLSCNRRGGMKMLNEFGWVVFYDVKKTFDYDENFLVRI